MKKTVALIGAIIMALSLCSCRPSVAKKAVKFTKEIIENNPSQTAKVVRGGSRGAVWVIKHTHKCSCNNGKVYSYGYWFDCSRCDGKGWYFGD